MNFEDSSLFLEVKNIARNGEMPVFNYLTATIHLKSEDLETIKVVQRDNNMDYEQNFTHETMLKVLLPFGKYAKRLYPERSNLEVTIKSRPMTEMGGNENTNKAPVVERYVAILLNQGNPLIEGDDSNIPSEDALDLSKIIEVDFQLIPKSVDLIRMKSVGGVYRGSTPEDTIKTLLTQESQALELPNELLPKGVTMVPSNNKTKRDHIVIPHGTKLIDLPAYVQNKCGGIYSAGIGFYYQDQQWYVYPLYDVNRFEESQKKVTIINVPGNKLVGIERTYRNDGSNTIILATGEAQFKDTSDYQQLNEGNGVRFADSSKFMNDFVSVKDNRATAARGGNVTEVTSTERASKRNNVHMSSERITANAYREYSELARREGSLINLLWENANPDLIHPGLPIKVLYMEDDVIRELQGVVLKAHEYTHMKGQVMFSNVHYTNLALSIFVNRSKIKI